MTTLTTPQLQQTVVECANAKVKKIHKDLVSLKTELQARVSETKTEIANLPHFIGNKREYQEKLVKLETQLATVVAIEAFVAEEIS